MERYKCKLCSKEFANGRALGGHMKSHFANLAIPPKTAKKTEQLSEPTESSSSLSFSEHYEEEEEERDIGVKGLVYGLRENPKRSFKLVDFKFSESGSVIEDSESETESSRNPSRQQRVKRPPKMGFVENPELGRPRIKPSSTESVNELEEECVARCLMMLSRDTSWRRSWSPDSDELRLSQRNPKRYECETCKKVFKSFQALGGHRTSHRKMVKSCNYSNTISRAERVHKCPICYKVFGSGQALGGHKRSHFLTSSSSPKLIGPCLAEKNSESLIDLNLPAPMEEEEEEDDDSAVSDAIHSQIDIL